MTADLTLPDSPPIRPRPGIVKALGIINIAGSVLLTLWVLSSAVGIYVMSMTSDTMSMPVPGPKGASTQASFNFGFMRDPTILRFWAIDLATGLPLNLLMFVTGIGLINQRRWAADWWVRAAWVKIVRLVLVYGYFVVGVVPVLSLGMARMVMGIFEAQKLPPGKGPTLSQMTMLYSWTYFAAGVATIVVGVIYPAVSIWLLGRPGVRAVLADKPVLADPAAGVVS